jgi:hypothetical protein
MWMEAFIQSSQIARNVAARPQERSSEAFKTFLNQLGDHWYPVLLDVFEVASMLSFLAVPRF